MPITDVQIRTIKCDGVSCQNTIAFHPQSPEEVKAMPDWVRNARIVQRGDGQNFLYCSDPCEESAVKLGKHNQPAPPVAPQVQPATEAEANATIAASKATEALKQNPTRKSPGLKLVTPKK